MRDKSVALELGGAERRLRFNLNALEAFEQQTGMSFSALRDQLNALPVRMMRVLLWACLITDEPELKIEQVGSWVDLENLQDVTEALRATFDKAKPAKPAAAAESAEDPLKPAPLTGTTSAP